MRRWIVFLIPYGRVDDTLLDDIGYSMGRGAMDGTYLVVSGGACPHEILWIIDKEWKPPHVVFWSVAVRPEVRWKDSVGPIIL